MSVLRMAECIPVCSFDHETCIHVAGFHTEGGPPWDFPPPQLIPPPPHHHNSQRLILDINYYNISNNK